MSQTHAVVKERIEETCLSLQGRRRGWKDIKEKDQEGPNLVLLPLPTTLLRRPSATFAHGATWDRKLVSCTIMVCRPSSGWPSLVWRRESRPRMARQARPQTTILKVKRVVRPRRLSESRIMFRERLFETNTCCMLLFSLSS